MFSETVMQFGNGPIIAVGHGAAGFGSTIVTIDVVAIVASVECHHVRYQHISKGCDTVRVVDCDSFQQLQKGNQRFDDVDPMLKPTRPSRKCEKEGGRHNDTAGACGGEKENFQIVKETTRSNDGVTPFSLGLYFL
jgi:hypothetical protein